MPAKSIKTMALSLFRIKKLLRRKKRLCAALLIAALYSARHPMDSWPRIVRAVTIWFDWFGTGIRTPFWIYFRRLRACYRCPVFYHRLRTCGSPLSRDLRDLGCWCNVEAKAGIIDADCWLYEDHARTDDAPGWPASARRLSPQ